MLRPFRFGLNTFGVTSLAAWKDLARRAEDQGYSTLSVADHTFTPLAPLSSLAMSAAFTNRLRLGTYVLGNDFWHPTIIAREAATIDLLSEGRLELGIGSGWRKGDYSERGLRLDPPGVRIERLEEAVRLIKQLFTGEPQSFSGKYYTTDGLVSRPTPVQRPHPPILIGGGGRRMLSLAARQADIVSLNLRTTSDGGLDFSSLTAEATLEKVGWVREAAGERFAQLELNNPVLDVTITQDRELAAARFLKGWGPLGAGVSPAEILRSPHVIIGSVEQIVDDLQMRRERFGLSYITLLGGTPDPDVFAPVVARLAGA